MWAKEQAFNKDAKTLGYTGSVNYYDTCGLGTEDGAPNTQWSILIIFNSVLYLCHSVFTLCFCVGVFLWPLICCGAIGHSLGALAQIASIVITGLFRYRSEGAACAETMVVIDIEDGTTFEDHGKLIQDLFISQCVIFLFYNCCVSMICQVSFANGVLTLHK